MRLVKWTALTALFVGASSNVLAGPLPTGVADVTFSYATADGGTRVLSEQRDFSGVGHDDALPLGGDHNLGYFNSVNVFGRRPLVPGLINPEETLLAHAFFKGHGNHDNFFMDIADGAMVTLEVQNIQFGQPVYIQRDTTLFHKQWDADQVDQLDNFYINLNNHDTETDPYRDFEEFFPGIFTDFPEPNYALGTLDGDDGEGSIEWYGDGTDTLGFKLTVPYGMFRHYEDVDQSVPDHLPAPFGFLEPFHFHFEWVISSVPEPTALLVTAIGGALVIGRRRR